MEYLEEVHHAERPLMPDTPEGRGHVRFLMDRFDDFSSALFKVFRDAEDTEAFENRLADLDDRLGKHDFLAGDDLTLADFMFLPWLIRAEARNVSVRHATNVAAWLDRLAARPGVGEEMKLFSDTAVAQAAAATR
jgi:glutathione S-transferase